MSVEQESNTINFKNVKPSIRGVPPKMIVYGRNGIGKSHFAASAPNAVFLDLDRNINELLCVSNDKDLGFPIQNFTDVLRFLAALLNNDHDFKTIIVDSLTTLQNLIEEQVCSEAGVKSLAAFDYGKGYQSIVPLWEQFLQKIDMLWVKKKMVVIMIGHHQVKQPPNLLGTNYLQYQLNLPDRASSVVQNWCSSILFFTDNPVVREEQAAFGQTINKVTQSSLNKRIIYTDGGTSFIAKNTYNLPQTIEFESGKGAWDQFYKLVKDYYAGFKGEKE